MPASQAADEGPANTKASSSSLLPSLLPSLMVASRHSAALPLLFLLLLLTLSLVSAFHDCVQPPKSRAPHHRHRRAQSIGGGGGGKSAAAPSPCEGGLCVGMHNGPHEGGPASYPVGTPATGYTAVNSTMTVPEPPKNQSGITYYIWTDIFFGDMGRGKMNQFVPQLILGSALDSSSGAPDYKPGYHNHDTWAFGAHYFFEVWGGPFLNETEGHAAYGKLYPARAGETLFTSFVRSPPASSSGGGGGGWTLEMGVVGDPERVSRVVVDKPYMGIGERWPAPAKTSSWDELNYTNMCINACWELYGANDRDHLPGSGSKYDIKITQGGKGGKASFPFLAKWDEDEGGSKPCPASTIHEQHSATEQHVRWDITVPPPT